MGFAYPLLCTFLMRACEQDESSSIIYIIARQVDAKCVGAIPTSHHLFNLLLYSLNRIDYVWLAGVPLAITCFYLRPQCQPLFVIELTIL